MWVLTSSLQCNDLKQMRNYSIKIVVAVFSLKLIVRPSLSESHVTLSLWLSLLFSISFSNCWVYSNPTDSRPKWGSGGGFHEVQEKSGRRVSVTIWYRISVSENSKNIHRRSTHRELLNDMFRDASKNLKFPEFDGYKKITKSSPYFITILHLNPNRVQTAISKIKHIIIISRH